MPADPPRQACMLINMQYSAMQETLKFLHIQSCTWVMTQSTSTNMRDWCACTGVNCGQVLMSKHARIEKDTAHMIMTDLMYLCAHMRMRGVATAFTGLQMHACDCDCMHGLATAWKSREAHAPGLTGRSSLLCMKMGSSSSS